MAGLGAGNAHERHASERALHHPFEVAADEAVDNEDVDSTLVVNNEDVRGVSVEQFAAADFDGEQ